MDRAGAAVTQMVFGKWNAIFGEDARGKEVVISYEVEEGEQVDGRGVATKTNTHDCFITFQIKDGSRRYNINDRSLGFRWFFSFMLFTQFRAARLDKSPVLFLFDEPASNLHAAAQQKLIKCFPEITRRGHALIYTTHSHYMIEPRWLEQTFIVTNRAEAPTSSIVDEISLDDVSLDVQAASYRAFVNKHPGQTSYFQPILDRLEVVPSRFDLNRASVILEGKSDYFILRYAAKMHGVGEPGLLPGLGAGTFAALISLHLGWNLGFLFLLDGDQQGRDEQRRYQREFGIPIKQIKRVDELAPGMKVIEDLLDTEAEEKIKELAGIKSRPSKAQIRRFFQERLASDRIVELGSKFGSRSRDLLDALKRELSLSRLT